ncbi:hypothetical protein GHO45_20325 [Pseudomonas sp. FSL R10-0765]|uniref:hypothetical protein n=1 Tax=Pseudomonas TaxID=286 RepID=UPI001296D5DA|nr:hypothetical protein [Pseudomonas sp. FSL R10-0765]MQT43270.1 hypothetical protein [Pseudomonas sp. FSL R10-0765]
MKWTVCALVLGLTFGSDVWAQSYSVESIAELFAEKDKGRGINSTSQREEQLLEMTQRAAQQCHNNLTEGNEAENVANMVILTRQKLDAAEVPITHYELLDVVYSALADGKKDWNCAAVLAMYLVLRTPHDGTSGLTHIAAYKTIQAGRDNGLLDPK